MKISISDLRLILEEIAPSKDVTAHLDTLISPGSKQGKYSRDDQVQVIAVVKSWNMRSIRSFVDQVDSRLKPLGWFVAEFPQRLPNPEYRTLPATITLRLQPETGIEATDLPNIIYHVTTTDSAALIKQSGLMPKQSSEAVRYAPRVYVATSKKAVVEAAEDQVTRFIKAGSLSIVTMKRPDGIKFFLDPEFGSKPDFVYSTEGIPAENVIDVQDVQTSDLRKNWKAIGERVRATIS